MRQTTSFGRVAAGGQTGGGAVGPIDASASVRQIRPAHLWLVRRVQIVIGGSSLRKRDSLVVKILLPEKAVLEGDEENHQPGCSEFRQIDVGALKRSQQGY